MTITVFGANGKVGRLVVRRLLEQGYSVRAFIHSRSDLPEHPNLTLVRGDVHDTQSVAEAISGSAAIISTLGSWKTKQKDILTSAMQVLIPAMAAANITRLISLTGAGARIKGDHFGPLPTINRLMLCAAAPKVLIDAEGHMDLLRASSLDWTVFRSPVMRNGRQAAYRLSLKPSMPWKLIHRETVAAAIVDALPSTEWHRAAPFIT